MKLTRLLFLFALLSGVALYGCSGDEPDSGVVLQRGLPSDPESLDQHKARSTQAAEVLRDLSEGLVGYTPTGELVPAAAERWDISADGLTYTFHLREQARWSNGDKLKAGDFVFGLRRLVAPATGAFYADMLAAVSNAPAIVAGELPVESLGIEAPDEQTLVLRLTRPTPYLLSLLTHPSTFPMHGTRRSLRSAREAGVERRVRSGCLGAGLCSGAATQRTLLEQCGNGARRR